MCSASAASDPWCGTSGRKWRPGERFEMRIAIDPFTELRGKRHCTIDRHGRLSGGVVKPHPRR
jgi:hypothetical protein